MTRESIQEMIAGAGADVASSVVRCIECPYEAECQDINKCCSETLRICNANYIEELNKAQGENKMTTMLPDNTIQINPQGEVEGLEYLSIEDLVKLSAAAYKALEKRREEEQERLWNKVVEAVTNYTKQFGDIRVLLQGDADVEFDYTDMNSRGEIDCA